MSKNDKIKDLVVLRNYHLESLKVVDRLIEEFKSLSPSNPRKRRDKRSERIRNYDNYLVTGKWKNQNELTDKTLKS